MRIVYLLILAVFPCSVFAQTLELVITPTRSETPIDQIGSSVTVITEEDIKQQQKQSVSQLLVQVPGIDVKQAGGVGQTTTVFTRGTPSEHTLVLIDGVEVNDPSSTAGSYGFENLNTDNIERIEVLRGNQSTLYGSNAIGGVISITTKQGKPIPSGWVSLEAGSYDTFKAASGISGKVDNVAFNVAASRFTTAGFSTYDKNLGGQGGAGADYANFSDRVDVKVNTIFNAYTTLRYNNARAQFDDFGFDANNDTHAKELSWRNAVKATLLDGKWDQEIGVSYYKLDRETILNGQYPGFYTYHGDRTGLDWLNHVKVNAFNLITFGAETKYETARTSDAPDRATQRINGYFAQDQINLLKNLYVTVGGRIDEDKIFGTQTTYRIAPAYTIEATNTRLKASYGTGFKAPSLYQLFSSYGNPNLSPETSYGYDFGFEQPFLTKRLTLGSTFFHNNITNLIDYDFSTNKYLNVNSTHINGIENFIQYAPLPSLQLKAQYTYTDIYDASSLSAVLRRSRHKAALSADYSFLEKGKAGVNASYNGKRDDIDFNFDRTTVPSYILVNITSSWQLTDKIALFGRVDNLLNKKYEDLYGYGTEGLSIYGGIKVSY